MTRGTVPLAEGLYQRHADDGALPNHTSAMRVRVLSLNMCVVMSGIRNKTLKTQIKLGFVASFVLLMAASTAAISNWAAIVPAQHWWAGLSVLLPLCLAVAWAVSVQAARVVSVCSKLIGVNYSDDCKLERLAALVRKWASKYDVVCIQECYRSFPVGMGVGHDYPGTLRDLARGAGLVHSYFPAGPVCPSISMSTGLMVLSRFAIEQGHSLSFHSQNVFEKLAVNRGALHVRLVLPPAAHGGASRAFDVFNAHVSPSLERFVPGVCRGCAERHSRGNRRAQVVQFRAWVEEHRSVRLHGARAAVQQRGDPCIIAGDFNTGMICTASSAAKAGGLTWDVEESRLMKILRQEMAAAGLRSCLPRAQWGPSTNYYEAAGGAPAEDFLRSTPQNYMDDHAFADPTSVRVERAAFFSTACPEGDPRWTHVSDHWGLHLEATLVW